MSRTLLFLLLLISTLNLSANYENLGLPFGQEMTRTEIEQILGRPGFLIYTKVALKGVPGYLDISVAGYRLPQSGHEGRLVTLLFFEDQIQLMASVFYEQKAQQKILKKIEKLKGFEKRSIENIPAFFNEKTLDLYLGAKAVDGLDFPPSGLSSYFQAEDFLNRKLANDLLNDLLAQVKEPRIGMASLTYTNIRLLASIAAQTTLSLQWRRR